MAPADIILQQLGGRRFTAMTGAKNIFSQDNGRTLSLQLPSRFAKDGINYLKITLEPSGTYRVEFGKIRGHSYKVIKTSTDIYCDQLQPLFTRVTGLDTHL